MPDDVQKHSVHTLVFRSLKRTHDMFLSDQGNPPTIDPKAQRIKRMCKLRDEYGLVVDAANEEKHHKERAKQVEQWNKSKSGDGVTDLSLQLALPTQIHAESKLVNPTATDIGKSIISIGQEQMLVPKKAMTMPKPLWHPPWKLYRVISGHLGWVRSIAVEPGNEWFATGASDRMIKIWDLATGTLKLSLTGHISAVRGLAVSRRNPYLFSCAEDKTVKCWDLEYNKVVRHYHGHLSAIYTIDLHPTIDILATAGRDSTARIWDMRTKACIHTLVGHSNTISSVKCQAVEPQVITASHDCTIRLWDLVGGKTRTTLTNHKKSVRSLTLHPAQYTFASGSPDNIKLWQFPDGNFIQNLAGHNAIVNTLSVNTDGVLLSGADNGTMHFWDWKTGYNFQRIQATPQPGSIDSESGIFASTYDQSGTRLITGEADKTIKIYKEDEEATEESHPINWRPNIMKKQHY